MDAREEETFKILMLPWLAHGHISPFLELAKRLTTTTSKFLVYFCSTPVILDDIKPNLPLNFPASIRLVELHLPSTPELPPHFHTTKGLPPLLMPTLRKAFAMAAPELETLLKSLNPDLLISDTLQPWVLPLASSLKVPTVLFSMVSAAVMAFVLNLTSPNKLPLSEFKLHDCWRSKAPHLYANYYESQTSDDYKQPSADIFIVKTSREIEAKYIDFLASLLKKKIVTTGSLVPLPAPKDEKLDIINWLDKKQPFSTVYVSLGSECYLSKEEMEEVAYGLESSEVNFIWVVRFPRGHEIKLEEALPEGFIQRAGELGKVIQGWAPQVEILAHPSIGGFLSHCGWSSLMECMMHGVPVICMPMQLDQPVCARLMEEIGVGVEVRRDEEGGIMRDEVAGAIKKVVNMGKSGEALRRKVKEISSGLRMRDAEEINGLATELVRLCEMKRAKVSDQS